jgi:uncharacterized protein YbjT (DUF2867 family)
MNDLPSVLLCGATGLVGGECLRLLSADPAFGRITVLTRRPLPAELLGDLDRSKVEEQVVDFRELAGQESSAEARPAGKSSAGKRPPGEQSPGELPIDPALFRVDRIFCALGTTIRKAGSRERFREVDHDYPLAVARLGVQQGTGHFLLVSAIGADPGSRVYYNRVKGEVEAAVAALPYRSLTLVRPSLLLGERDEFRLGEEVMKQMAFLLPRKYKAVEARAVAAALVQAAREDAPGRRAIESKEIPALADAYFAGRQS